VLQAIKIVREPDQQGLATLGEQASSGSAAREFTFGHGEDGFDQGATAVFLARKMVAHLGADAVDAPGFLPAFGGDDAQSMKLLADKGVIALGIELGVGQHAAHGSVRMGLSDGAPDRNAGYNTRLESAACPFPYRPNPAPPR
jgi:hypothetical protein